MQKIFLFPIVLFLMSTCFGQSVKLITLDPGHFHAALVQKSMYADVDSTVHVYAPAGNDLQWHLDRIKDYNTRSENPTHWNQQVDTGANFFERMIAEKKGNVVVLSGNNKKKTSYILKSLQNGFNVLSDKPLVIDSKGFEQLKKAFMIAEKNKLLLYDIMTERFEINTILQRELSMIPEIFGTLEKGTSENPAITKESVHHFYKLVSGNVLTRPAWFLDASQQGEGIVDVMTHLVDLVQWECFPEKIIHYKKDIKIIGASRWPTLISQDRFSELTKMKNVPAYLQKYQNKKNEISVLCNGEINYTLKGVHAKVTVQWNYKAPDGTGDTHYSIMRGTKANLIIKQGAEQNYKPTLYIEPLSNTETFEIQLQKSMAKINQQYNGVTLKKNNKGWEVIIPEILKEGHEAHFARVTDKYLDYFLHKNMPAWEGPNMLAKYYTTTEAQKLAVKK